MAAGQKNSGARWVTVWDPLVRVFHWSLGAAVLLALMSADNRSFHEALGYTAILLIFLRTAWGFFGPGYARFSTFVRPPGTVLRYLVDMIRFRDKRYLGHNPAGGAMIVLLMLGVLTAGVSGWLSETDRFFGVSWVEDLHSFAGNALIALIVLHVAGVLASSLLHRENLVRAMITGKKPAFIASDAEQPTAEPK